MLVDQQWSARSPEHRRGGVADVARGASRARGRVVSACHLADDVTLVCGWCLPHSDLPRTIEIGTGRERWFVFTRPHVDEFDELGPQPRLSPTQYGFLAILRTEVLEATAFDVAGVSVFLDPERIDIVDVQSLAWSAMSGVDGTTRDGAAAFVATALTAGGSKVGTPSLAAKLATFRDAIRIRPPHCKIAVDDPRGLFVASIHKVGERSFYLKGWMRDANGDEPRLVVVSPEGSRCDLTGRLVRFERSDVDEFYSASAERTPTRPGFLCFFELDVPSHLRAGWVLEMSDRSGDTVEAVAPDIVDDMAGAQALLLADLVYADPGDEGLIRDHAFPALTKLQERRSADGMLQSVTQYGEPPADPDVSIVVPLYQRIDFVEHQMAQWCRDEDLARSDLIYVLDSPEIAGQLTSLAQQLQRLYGVSFRVAVLRRNVGYAHANNAGASLARGRLLLLLNSDVLPEAPGWLSQMRSRYDAMPQVGAMGPKLVYEDGSIQHAGMYFLRNNESSLWENAHYYKGLHRSFGPANIDRAVPAVTGACLLVARELWAKVGGLKGTYIQGDYEDSDLCLRLAALGYESWYVSSVELYHLEGQSYPTPLRRMTSQFNTWLHSHLWTDHITELMRRSESSPTGQPPFPIGAS
jgi:GT2 family glycosyltransferase